MGSTGLDGFLLQGLRDESRPPSEGQTQDEFYLKDLNRPRGALCVDCWLLHGQLVADRTLDPSNASKPIEEQRWSETLKQHPP